MQRDDGHVVALGSHDEPRVHRRLPVDDDLDRPGVLDEVVAGQHEAAAGVPDDPAAVCVLTVLRRRA
jgi:hypothetical protein